MENTVVEPSTNCLSSNAESLLRCAVPRVVPIDEALRLHLSQAYWDWRALFDRDCQSNPLQHADYVLAELGTAKSNSKHRAVLLRDGSERDCQALGILVPKDARTSQVGGLGPSWSVHGLQLVGGRFLTQDDSIETQTRLLSAAVQHCDGIGAGFLLIEDLDESSPLRQAVDNEAASGCRLFAIRDLQPRWRIEFPATAEDYWKTFSSRQRQLFRVKLRKSGQSRLCQITDIKQIPDFLLAAHDISKMSWQSRQFGLRIRNDESELRRLSVLAQHGHLRSYVWEIEGRPAAFMLSHQYRGHFRAEEIAYCPEFQALSPGRTMLQQVIEDLFQHDSPQWFDFGSGDAEYKQQFGNRKSRSQSLWIVPPSRRAGTMLIYLNGCRQLRSAARGLVNEFGLETMARQWLRNGDRPVQTKSHSSALRPHEDDTNRLEKSGAETP